MQIKKIKNGYSEKSMERLYIINEFKITKKYILEYYKYPYYKTKIINIY